MKFSEVKQEFEIRYYLWSKSEFEKEIEESFPNFRCFKAGPSGRRISSCGRSLEMSN